MQRIILHIDFDSFFASVEQQYNPLLRGKPIGVTATHGRTCIIAASKEAKKYGIKTGTRSFEAEQLCPFIQLVPADFNKYLTVSKKFLDICKDYSPFVELFSIDEVFIDVSQTVHLFGSVDAIVSLIRKRIACEIGIYITASVGISHNKLLAKLASGMQKPNGLVKITPNDVETIYKKAALTDICGIGERTKLRLYKLGIYTLLQLREIPFYTLKAEFGNIEAQFLKNIGLGKDFREVIPYTLKPSVKSVGRNYCLPKNEYNQRVILQNIYELCQEIGVKLRRLNKKAKTVGLGLRGTRTEYGRISIDKYIDTEDALFFVCKRLYDSWGFGKHDVNEDMVRMISVWAENLVEKANTSLPLFEDDRKKEQVVKAIDTINEKFGHHTIRNGFLLYADKLTTVPNGWMADKYERTKLATNRG